jgi:hypothetical protein
MSSHHEELTLNLPLAASRAACQAAASGPGWRLTRQEESLLACMEIAQPGLSFTNPAQVEIGLASAGDGATHVDLRGSNFGFGPIQSSHVRQQVQALLQQIRQAAKRSAEPAAARTYTRSVIVNGARVTDEELAGVEPSGVRVSDGRYWYDRVSGGWGLEGGPTAGFVVPGLKLGAPLHPDASNGDTGVFINGRQLHTQDVAVLQQLIGMVMPGRWWVDAQGNFGPEGFGMMGNLRLLAQQRAVPASGSGHMSSSGATVGGAGGFVYAQGRDALGNYFSASSG